MDDFVNEAIFMVQEQIARAEDIDTLFKTRFKTRCKYLQTADLIGLDTIFVIVRCYMKVLMMISIAPAFIKEKWSMQVFTCEIRAGFYRYQQTYAEQ